MSYTLNNDCFNIVNPTSSSNSFAGAAPGGNGHSDIDEIRLVFMETDEDFLAGGSCATAFLSSKKKIMFSLAISLRFLFLERTLRSN